MVSRPIQVSHKSVRGIVNATAPIAIASGQVQARATGTEAGMRMVWEAQEGRSVTGSGPIKEMLTGIGTETGTGNGTGIGARIEIGTATGTGIGMVTEAAGDGAAHHGRGSSSWSSVAPQIGAMTFSRLKLLPLWTVMGSSKVCKWHCVGARWQGRYNTQSLADAMRLAVVWLCCCYRTPESITPATGVSGSTAITMYLRLASVIRGKTEQPRSAPT